MTAPTAPTALVPAGPVFSELQRLALSGFLAGYSVLNREALAPGLRQFAAWFHVHGLRLFGVRRADIECFSRDLEAAGRSRATVTRRMRTIAGLYMYAGKEPLEHSPAVRPSAAALARIRPRALTAMPRCLPLTRTSATRCRPGAVRPVVRAALQAGVRACSMNGASFVRKAGAFLALVSIAYGHLTSSAGAGPSAIGSPERTQAHARAGALGGMPLVEVGTVITVLTVDAALQHVCATVRDQADRGDITPAERDLLIGGAILLAVRVDDMARDGFVGSHSGWPERALPEQAGRHERLAIAAAA